MLPPRDESEDPGPCPIPVVYDLPIAQPEHDVAARDELEVATPILLECVTGMERATIDLDDEPIADEDVDPTDAVDVDLNPVPDPARPKEQSNRRLDTGLGVGVRSIDQRASGRRHPCADEVEVR